MEKKICTANNRRYCDTGGLALCKFVFFSIVIPYELHIFTIGESSGTLRNFIMNMELYGTLRIVRFAGQSVGIV